MDKNLLTLKRKHVLGNLYNKCENISSIPVYLEGNTNDAIGTADEELGRYTDAFSFHLPEDICKKLSSNGYVVAFDYDFCDKTSRKIKLNHFVLVAPLLAIAAPKKKIEIGVVE